MTHKKYFIKQFVKFIYLIPFSYHVWISIPYCLSTLSYPLSLSLYLSLSTSSYHHLSLCFPFNKRSSYCILYIVHPSIHSYYVPLYVYISLVQRYCRASLINNDPSPYSLVPILRPSIINNH